MRKRHAIAIATALALPAQQDAAVAQAPESAYRAMLGCRDFVANANSNMYLQGVCAGVVRSLVFVGRSLGICRPSGANVAQSAKVVVAYIDQRPERMHEQFESLAIEAVQQAWSCQR